MPEPGSPEWHERLAQILAEETTQPERWWYLSFADDETFFGACIVKARGMTGAIRRAHELKINPGGQVMAFPIAAGIKIEHPVNALLSKADLGEGAMSFGELEAQGITPGAQVGTREPIQ